MVVVRTEAVRYRCEEEEAYIPPLKPLITSFQEKRKGCNKSKLKGKAKEEEDGMMMMVYK